MATPKQRKRLRAVFLERSGELAECGVDARNIQDAAIDATWNAAGGDFDRAVLIGWAGITEACRKTADYQAAAAEWLASYQAIQDDPPGKHAPETLAAINRLGETMLKAFVTPSMVRASAVELATYRREVLDAACCGSCAAGDTCAGR